MTATQPRNCYLCRNRAEGERGIWCFIFQWLVVDPKLAAEDCDAYDPDPMEIPAPALRVVEP